MKPHLSGPLVLTVWLCLMVMKGAAAPLSQRPDLPNFDHRTGGAAANAASERQASTTELRAQVAGVRIDFDEVVGAPKWIRSPEGYLSGPGGEGKGISAATTAGFAADDPYRTVKAFIQEHHALFGHGPDALTEARVDREYVTPHNGMQTTVWQQELDGIAVYEGVFATHLTKAGELIAISSQFVADPSAAADAGAKTSATRSQPGITAQQAVIKAAGSLDETVDMTGVKPTESSPTGQDQRQQFTAAPFNQAIDARLVWLPMNPSLMQLCWEVTMTSRTRGETFRLLVDARTGEVLVRRCLTVYLSDVTYRVYTSDSPSPFSPGWSTPSTVQPALTSRALVTWSAFDTNASPNGWIDDGVNETRGNNADAHTDHDANDSPDLPRPQGSPFRVFDCPMDLTQSPATYTNAAVVQLFYLCNFMHDRLYELGFTEAAGNYQNNNFGRGGLGNDAVQADAQDGSGYNNANFTPTSDGTPPRIQMYLFNGVTPNRDGDFDAEVVLHEYTHGLSERLVGGGVGISALQTGGMGEGWSDWYAMSVLSESGDDVNGCYATGGYVTYLLSGMTQNYYFGIRRYPYSTDLTKNPLTFKDIDPAQASSHAGIPRSSIIGTTANEVHNMGEVWCVTLWEARAKLVAKLGWTLGNEKMMQLATDGMKLGPANPNFLQARDGILLADQVDNGGANRNELWAAFAKRGMGSSATSPSSSTTTGLQEAYDVPDDLRITPTDGFTGIGPVGGPFSPNSITFAVTNAGSNSLSWTLVNTSAWLNVLPAGGTLNPGGPATPVTASLTASASSLPMGIYTSTAWFTNLNDQVGQARQFTLRVGQPDYFTELFDSTANDLAFKTFTFTPDGSGNFYAPCRETAAAFPTDPTGGTAVTMSDDTYAQVTLSGTNTVAIYGRRSNVFYIGSNGYLTMDSGDTGYTESFATHFSRPRVSALFDDLYPVTGQVTWLQFSNRVAVTYLNVREYGASNTNSFQIELFYDGRIRLTYLGLAALDGLAGLSAGLGVPAGFVESDLSSYGSCSLPLIVFAPSNATEGDGVLAGAGQVRLLTAPMSNLTVALASSDTTEVTVPVNVTVLAGQTNAMFDLTIVDDGELDGTQTATITATASGYTSASAGITVYDNEAAALRVVLPATATEGQGTVTGAVQVVGGIPGANTTVNLASSDTTEIQVPASVFIPSGQTSAVFTATVVDDNQIDGPQTATVTAHIQNWTNGSALITVLDNENTDLIVTLPANAREGDGVLVNAGVVNISGTLPTNLVVALASDDITELVVPPTATILAGQTSGMFNLTVVDDLNVDGAQIVHVTASAGGFAGGSRVITIYDNESPPVPANPSPAHLATNVIQTTGLSWQSGALSGEVISNDVYFGTTPTPGPGELIGTTTNTSWTLPLLAPQTTYYWQIVARKTGTTAGPVWQFTTRGVDHFVWAPVYSPQAVNQPFSTTITAKDGFNTTVSNFNNSVSLAGYGNGGGQTTNRIFDGFTPFQLLSGTYCWGYLFTPTNNLVVTHVRHYFNAKVCLWTGAGVLLATQNVSGSQGTWNETALATPVQLAAGSNYVVAAFFTNSAYFDITNVAGGFPDGTIGTSLYATSDTFPTIADAGYWPLVGLSYTVGSAAPITITPTNSGSFVNGTWSGNLTVLQPATNIVLRADDGSGHAGSSNPFDVLMQNDISISMVDSPDPVSAGASLTYTLAVANTGPAAATGVIVTNVLPGGVSFVLAMSSQGTCTQNGGLVTCNLGTISGGTNATATIIVVPTAGGLITNVAVVSRAETDPYPANNSATVVTAVQIPALSINDVSLLEGNSGSTFAAFTVNLTPASALPVNLMFATADGTATAGSDYAGTNGTLNFAPGQTNQAIVIGVNGDTFGEADETFFVNLSSPTNATLARAQGIGTILNDDVPPAVYLRSTAGAPWGSTANEAAMNQAFGVNNWQDLRYETVNPVGLFSPVNQFIFMEGSDMDALEMQAFLTTNLPSMQNWVTAGGRLFLNAAPNEGSGMSLGFGVSLVYSDSTTTGTAANPSHPIFQGPFLPVGLSWTGTYFGHATVTGGALVTLITNNANGHIVLAEMQYGNGLVLFGGMTTPNFHTPVAEAANLRANILAYTATRSLDSMSVSPSDGLVSQGYEGGPFTPSNKVYTVSNGGSNTFNWSASGPQTWVPILTNTAPEAVRAIVINSPQNCRFFRAVASTAGAPPVLSESAYAAEQFHCMLAGQSNATYTIEALTDLQAQPWVTVNPSGGSLAPGASTNVTVLINPNACSFTSGAYTTTVDFRNLAGGAVQARPVSLTVLMLPPTVISQPTNQTVPVSAAATFSVTAGGTGPLSYFWKRNGVSIPGANEASYSLTNAQLTDSGSKFSCLVTNGSGSIVSSNAILKVVETVANDSCSGAIPVSSGLYDAAYTNTQSTANATSTGDPVPDCVTDFGNGVWYQFTPPTSGLMTVDTLGSDFDTGLTIYTGTCGALNEVACNDDADGMTSQITVPVTGGSTCYILAGGYSAHVGNLVFHLNYATPPVVMVQPASQTVAVGSNVTLTAVIGGSLPLTCQWQFNDSPMTDGGRVSGTTTTSLNIVNAQTSDTGTYTLVVTNLPGSTTSTAAVLTVMVPPSITTQPISRSVPLGLPASFSAAAAGDIPLSYQWQLNGTNIPGATGTTYSISAANANDFGTYHLVVSNAVGVATSADALLTWGQIAAWGRNDNGETVVPPNLTNVVMISAGGGGASYSHSLALLANGTVVAWGDNRNGQTNVPASATNVVAVAAGGMHSLALRSDGTVIAWGNNASLQANVPSNLSNVVAIAADGVYSLALRSDGKVVAWGFNNYGQTSVPAALSKAVAIGAGTGHGLAVRYDGLVFAWGYGYWGQTNVPLNATNVIAVAGGLQTSLALRADGSALTWGTNNYPMNVPAGLTNATAIGAGDNFYAALRSGGAVLAWGNNVYGQTNVPTGVSNAVAIAAGGSHVLALLGDGRPQITRQPVGGTTWVGRDFTFHATVAGTAPLACQWQLNGEDIPGATNTTLALSGISLTNAGSYQLIASNAQGTTASIPVPLTILNNTTLSLWSQPVAQTNYQGSKMLLSVSVLGNGPLRYQWYYQTNIQYPPTPVSGATNADLIWDPALAIHSGNYYVAVSNQFNRSINSSTVTLRALFAKSWGYLSTDPPFNLTNAVAIAVGNAGSGSGSGHYLALRSDGKISAWGVSFYGETNTAALSNSMVTAIAAGYEDSLALRSDGTVYAWGYGYNGQTNVPSGLSGVAAIACGYQHDLAAKSDGTLAAWGMNSYGQATNYPAATNVIAVAAGYYHSLALRADGTVVGWGYNGYGQTTIPASATNVIAIAVGDMHSLALRADGTVIGWGFNSTGPLAIPAGLSNVVAISAGYIHSTALRSDGTIVTWGGYYIGNATAPPDLANVVQIASGGDHDVGLFGTRAPAFTIQPFNRTVPTGTTNVLLAAKAAGVQPVAYQWQLNGVNLAGATNDTLKLTNLQFAQAGAYRLVASNAYGVVFSKPAKLAVIIPLGEALDTTNRAWTTSGSALWYGQTNITHDNVDAARSGDIGNSQETVLQTTVVTNWSGHCTFWWKVSSEDYFDVLEFRLNGVLQTSISGEVDWQPCSIAIPAGTNTLQWRYSKDASYGDGQDAGWVDQFVFLPDPPVFTLQPVSQTVNMGSNVQFRVSVNGLGPFNYRLQKDSTNCWWGSAFVAGNNATFTLDTVKRMYNGAYSVVVSNNTGVVTSSNALLKVLVPQKLGNPVLLPDGTLQLTSGDADGGLLSPSDLASFEAQASTNLTDWVTLSNSLSLTNGMLWLQDSPATNCPQRFYRIIENP